MDEKLGGISDSLGDRCRLRFDERVDGIFDRVYTLFTCNPA